MAVLACAACSVLLGFTNWIFLFCYFRPDIRHTLYYRLGSKELGLRMAARSPLGRFLYLGFQKHISDVWLTMNAALPCTGLAAMALAVLGFEMQTRLLPFIGMAVAGAMSALSLWLMLMRCLFGSQKKEVQVEIQRFSVVLFVTGPLLVYCLLRFK